MSLKCYAEYNCERNVTASSKFNGFFVHSSYTVLLRCRGSSFFFGPLHNLEGSLDEWSACRKASTWIQDNKNTE
jgi:hypothetical protein